MGSPDNSTDTVQLALKQLDALALAEYGKPFAETLNGLPRDLYIRTLARLGGIELKKDFADASEMNPAASVTHAQRQWNFKPELEREVFVGDPAEMSRFRSLEGTPSYDLQVHIYESVKGSKPTMPQLAAFLLDAQQESLWFLYLIDAVRPSLCGHGGENDNFWKLAKEAANHITVTSTEAVLAYYLNPLIADLHASVLWLPVAPAVATFVLAFLIVHLSKVAFCNVKIDSELILTLRLQNNFENR
jgi:hypothetical protein